ncbi:2144_t:CDS:2 [Ambispora gerdemannii]|uniref:Nucleotide exchange factor SIL1 n=1 Tax=Ambispora gerdemannii TaxID=144530 RepID=A0A9N8V9Y3_9GLOM|nr:2144_t:CDS:2 [Ambispora gerdemannii]
MDAPSPHLIYKKDDNTICSKLSGHCYHKVFQPTSEFQNVLEGQEVPTGLHIRVDINTGMRQAKLLDADETATERTSVILLDENGNSIIKEETSITTTISKIDEEIEIETPKKANFHKQSDEKNSSLPLLVNTPKPNKHIPHSDYESFDGHLKTLSQSHDAPIQELINALDGLEDLVHELDFGVRFANSDGVLMVIELLYHINNEVKVKAATVLGTAMQNNPFSQKNAISLNLIPRLLDIISYNHDNKYSSRLLYALSSIIRGNSEGVQSFLYDNQGLLRLAAYYASNRDEEIRAKCAIFITDLFDPKMVTTTSESDKKISYNNHHQHQQGIDEWCRQFQSSLFNFGNGIDKNIGFDSREKILGGLAMIKGQYPDNCHAQPGLIKWLDGQNSELRDEPENFEEYIQLIKTVQKTFEI